MPNKELTQEEIKTKIYEAFPEAIKQSTLLKMCLEYRTFHKLSEELTTGNHEVYTSCYQGNVWSEATEDGILILFPGSGIIKHKHPTEKGIWEEYHVVDSNNFHFEGNEYDQKVPNVCSLGKSHGVDIEDTPRIIHYSKINEFILEEHRKNIQKNTALSNTYSPKKHTKEK